MQGPTNRRVKMIAPTYIKGNVAEAGTIQDLSAAMAAEFVSHGRALYVEARHTDTESPPSTVSAEEETLDVSNAAALVPNASSTLSLKK